MRRVVRLLKSSKHFKISALSLVAVISANQNGLCYCAPLETIVEPHNNVCKKAAQVAYTRSSFFACSSAISDTFSKLVRCMQEFAMILLRGCTLALLYTPALAFSPVLVFGNQYLEHWWWNLLRSTICWSGPCFIKLCQWAAMRPDVFHKTICREMSLLQSRTLSHAWEHTARSLVHELGPNWDSWLFLDKEELLGSGCVAQVYRGQVRASNTVGSADHILYNGVDLRGLPEWPANVAVKVLHPNIRHRVNEDIHLLSTVADVLDQVGALALHVWSKSINNWGTNYSPCQQNIFTKAPNPVCISLSDTIQEFAVFMNSQLDMRAEAFALEKMGQNFSSPYWRCRVTVPKPLFPSPKSLVGSADGIAAPATIKSSHYKEQLLLDDYNSVLIESYHTGTPLKEILHGIDNNTVANDGYTTHQQSLSCKEIASLGLDVVLKMIFEDNFLHADLHGGNILVTASNSEDCNNVKDVCESNDICSKNVGTKGVKLVLLDAGLVVHLNDQDRMNLTSLFDAVISNDGQRAAHLLIENSPRRRHLINSVQGDSSTIVNSNGGDNVQRSNMNYYHSDGSSYNVECTDAFEKEMAALLNRVHEEGLSLGKTGVASLIQHLLQISYQHNVQLDSKFVTIVVAVMLAEGMGRRLDPNIDIIRKAAPYVRSAAFEMLKKQTNN